MLLSACGNNSKAEDASTKADSKVSKEESVENTVNEIEMDLANRLEAYIHEYDSNFEKSKSEELQVLLSDKYYYLSEFLVELYFAAGLDMEDDSFANDKKQIKADIRDLKETINAMTFEEKEEFIKNMQDPGAIYYSYLDSKCVNVANVITSSEVGSVYEVADLMEENSLSDEQFEDYVRSYKEKYENDLEDLKIAIEDFKQYRALLSEEQLALVDKYTESLISSQENIIQLVGSILGDTDGDIDEILEKEDEDVEKFLSIQKKITKAFDYSEEN